MLGRACLLLLLGSLAGCGEEPERPQDTGERQACAEGWLLDGGRCVPERCGTGTWGNLEVDEATVHVDTQAAEGGDGSAEAPLRSIQAAADLAGGRGGGLVAVAAGSYPEILELSADHADVHLAGRCRELVTLDASVGDEDTEGILIDGMYAEIELSELRVADSAWVGVRVKSGYARLTGLEIAENASVGLVVVRRGPPEPTQVMVEDCEIIENTWMGIYAFEPDAEITLVDTVIRDTRPDPDAVDEAGYGIGIHEGAVLRAEGCVLSGNRTLGILALEPDTEVTLVDTVIRDTLRASDGKGGYGVQVLSGAAVRLEGCELTRNTGMGLYAGNQGTELTAADTTIRDTLPARDGENGQGIQAYGGVMLRVDRCELAGNAAVGIVISDAGSRGAVVDTVVRDTSADEEGEGGFGIGAYDGVLLSVERCELLNNTAAGFLAAGPGTQVSLHDTSIIGTMPDISELGASAAGLAAQEGASVTASGLTAQGNEGPGLYAIGLGTILACTDCALHDNAFANAVAIDSGTMEIRSSTISGARESINLGGGAGVYAAQPWGWAPPAMLVVDTAFSDNLVGGAWFHGEGEYRLEGVAITGGIGVPHGTTTRCGDGVYATGVAAWDGSAGLSIQGSTLLGNRGAGLFLDNASARLDDNAWSDNHSDLLVQGEACLTPRDDYAEAPNAEICPVWERPTCALAFGLMIAAAEIDPAMPPPPMPILSGAEFQSRGSRNDRTHALPSAPGRPRAHHERVR